MIYIKTLYKKFGEIKTFFNSAYCFEIHQCYWMYYYFFPFLIEQYSFIEYAKVFKSIFLLIDNWIVSSFLGIKNQLLTSSVWFGMHGASVQFSSVEKKKKQQNFLCILPFNSLSYIISRMSHKNIHILFCHI